jgi:RNA polymerase sigma factor (sigma-70 family)
VADGHLTVVLRHLRELVRRQAAGGVEDHDLLERFTRQRDEAAFEVLVWRHGPAVLALCQRLLHNAHDAEDVLQATFLTLVRKADSIRKRQSLASWLYKVAYRIALRARARSARATADTGPVETLPEKPSEDEVVWRELRPILDEAIQRLPEKYRTPIILCYLQGKTNREAAEQLGCPLGTVSTRLTRARELLRRRLAHHGVSLSVATLGAILSHHAVSAAVSAPLVTATVRAASVLRASGITAAGAISANVLGLVEGGSKAMLPIQLKIFVAVVMAGGALVAGAHAVARRDPAGPEPGARQEPPPTARQTQDWAKAASTRPAAGQVPVGGRVLGPDGQPVAGARLYWPRLPTEPPRSEEDVEFPERSATGVDGRFRFELLRSEIRPEWEEKVPLLAAADGFGVGGVKLPAAGASTDLTLRLVKDHPVRGRVVTTEGKPLAGLQVKVAVVFPRSPSDLGDFLTGWKQEWQLAHPRWMQEALYLPGRKGWLTTETDKDGRFEIRGVGADRVAVLLVKGPAVSQGMLYVVNREGFDAAPYNRAARERDTAQGRMPGNVPVLYPPTFEYVTAATRRIEGTVHEAGTGKPVAGISISVGTGYNNGVNAVTDAQGRYALVGLPKMKEYRLIAEPRANDPWLRRVVALADTEGFQPIRLDFELTRGIVITGRVIDRATGKGVRGGVRYVPVAGNKYFGTKTGYDAFRYERLTTPTDAQGRFRLAVIPGTGVLVVQAFGSLPQVGGQSVNPYKQATVDPADRPRLQPVERGGSRYFTAADNSVEFLSNQNAVKVLDLAEDAGPVAVDLYVDTGRTLTVRVEDPDGQPLAGATVSGMTATWPIAFPLQKASCTVYALDPPNPRRLAFFHPGRNLGGTVTVRGDENEPPVARLTPAGEVTGRVLDAAGQPVAGAMVMLSLPDDAMQELYRLVAQRQEPVRTGTDGRFRVHGVIANMKFGLNFQKERAYLVGEPRIGQKQVAPGQLLDLGDLRTKPLAR